MKYRHVKIILSFMRRLGLNKGSKVLDCGCGIGGPYRNIAEFTGWNITGITLNDYQVSCACFYCSSIVKVLLEFSSQYSIVFSRVPCG